MYVSFILAQEKHIYTISDISIVLTPLKHYDIIMRKLEFTSKVDSHINM